MITHSVSVLYAKNVIFTTNPMSTWICHWQFWSLGYVDGKPGEVISPELEPDNNCGLLAPHGSLELATEMIKII